MTYTAAEPEKVTRYSDQTGGVHTNRDDALAANFKADFHAVLEDAFERHTPGTTPPSVVEAHMKIIADVAKHHPDMLRILLDDRDFT